MYFRNGYYSWELMQMIYVMLLLQQLCHAPWVLMVMFVTDDGIKPTCIIPIIQIQGTCNDFENIRKLYDQLLGKFIPLNSMIQLHEP